MTELPIDAPLYNKAVEAEWEGTDILVYDKNRVLINIYHEFDLIEMAIQHHNNTLGRRE